MLTVSHMTGSLGRLMANLVQTRCQVWMAQPRSWLSLEVSKTNKTPKTFRWLLIRSSALQLHWLSKDWLRWSRQDGTNPASQAQ